ncbi:sigma factor-like helix-turn-helix DNA-binding protein [Streptomyces sp. NPDC057445]|uniref:sigma factor-like helix-turn-helix DNA-binding protein n=1 Tax=Streptomyces sp. NPDC057445 TaxID=3346136 RepID=UPI003677E6F0
MRRSTQDNDNSASADGLPSPKERRRLREAKSLTEDQLAEAVGVTRATIKSWETGRTDPRGRKRDAYAKLLAVYAAEIAAKEAGESWSAGEAGNAGEAEGTGDPLAADRAHGPVEGRRFQEAPRSPEASGERRQHRWHESRESRESRESGESGESGESEKSRSGRRPQETSGSEDDTEVLPRTAGLPGKAQRPPAAAQKDRDSTAAPRGPWQTGENRRTRSAPAPSPYPPPFPAQAPPTAEEAFDALYTRIAPSLARQAYLLTGRRELSLEAVEHAFHVAWQRWPEVAVDRDPAGWVRAVAYEYAMSPWHRLRRDQRRPDASVPDSISDASRRTLRETLLELPPPYRRTLLLYDGLGLDLPETAAETEASTPAAANRLLHARAVVAERLPELADPELLQARLADLIIALPTPEVASPVEVREGSERRTQFWTRASIGLTAVIIGASVLTMAIGQSHYEAPQAPGQSVRGVPPNPGPPALTAADVELRTMLQNHPLRGPARLTPAAR